jgi:hypothetical protein
MRVSKLILSLKKLPHEEVAFAYERIFRFLADILTQEQFDKLSYYHVTRLITKIHDISNVD